eukprot:RCo035732
MTEFQKASQAVQSITTRLDALSSRLAEDPANEFEEQNAYFCMNTELMDVEHILSEGSSLSSKIHGFKERASETDPNKQIYGPEMKDRVQRLAQDFALQRDRTVDIRTVLEAVHVMWEGQRQQKEEERRQREAAEQAATQAAFAERQRKQAAEEARLREQQKKQEALRKKQEEERRRKASEKKK